MGSSGRCKWKTIWLRWRGWVVLAVTATVLWLVVGAWQAETLREITRRSVATWILAGTVAMLALLSPALRGVRATLAFYDLRHFWLRPPYWLAILGGAVAALWLAREASWISELYGTGYGLDPRVEVTVGFAAFVGVMALVHSGLALWHRCRDWRQKRSGTAAATPLTPPVSFEDVSDEKLLAWIRSDDAINEGSQDLLGCYPIARRMVDRLTAEATQSDDDRSQALLGPLGSGKTTILRMAECELKVRGGRDLEILEIQMWAFETARAAVTGIIDKIVAALGEHVNVVGLRGVSGAYAEAISKVPHGSILLAALRGRTESPTDLLAELNEIASVIGMRYVIWIEDLERFANGNQSDDKLGVVRALLHGLHQLSSFTIIVASIELSHGFDLQKIARYVEHVPPLRADTVKDLCEKFMTLWHASIAGTASEVDYDAGESSSGPKGRYNRALRGVFQVALTPRALKQALRRCDEVWTALRGEINLEQALAFSIVRESFPRAYALIEDRRGQFLKTPRLEDPGYDAPANRCSVKPSEVEQLLEELRIGLDKKELFSATEIADLAIEVFVGRGREVLQSFGVQVGSTDYWQRFNAQALSSKSEERDQNVLRVFKSGTQDEALDMLATSYGGPAAEHLARWIGWKSLSALLVPCARRHMTKPSQVWNDLWWILLYGRGIPGRTKADLMTKAQEVIDVCSVEYRLQTLAATQRVLSEWSALGYPRPFEDPMDSERATLRSHVVASLVRSVTDPDRLMDAVRGAPSDLLVRLIREPEDLPGSPPPALGTVDEDLGKLAAVILKALYSNPELMAPQVAELLGRRVNGTWTYEPMSCEQLFEDPDSVLETMVKCSVKNNPMDAVRAAWAARQEELAKAAAADTSDRVVDRGQANSTLANAIDGIES